VTARKRELATEWNTLSQAAVARMLGVTTTRVGQWIADGRLPARRVEGWARLRVLKSDAQRFARRRERHTAT
jgi:excisionase family DNA binding protein